MTKLLALDLDGTVLDENKQVADALITLFERFHDKEWKIAFITGRMFAYAHQVLKSITVPYILACQNGADVVEMPSGELLKRNYFPFRAINFRKLPQNIPYIVYSGKDSGDYCYYNPQLFSNERGVKYINKLKSLSPKAWKTIDSIEEIIDLKVPLVKFFGSLNDLMRIEALLKPLTATTIRDTIDPNLYILLVTDESASKGKVLTWIEYTYNISWIVAAGDDRNDVPLFMHSDHAIAMKHAPLELKELADEVAEQGLITALKRLL